MSTQFTPGPWIVFHNNDGPDEVVGVTSRATEHLDSDGDGAALAQKGDGV